MQMWVMGVASPRRAADYAAGAEAAGWDGMLVVDSQNLSGDPYVALAMAATSTTRLGLATGVTNPVTRNAAATASAIASVQKLSNGRAVLGIGRGDSALAHLGHAPARLGPFETYVATLQRYLSGEAVEFSVTGIDNSLAPPVANLGLADTPETSRISWLKNASGDPGDRKVPVEVAATGPRVIAIAARYAERVMFALGADVARLQWGINTARDAAREHGRDPDSLCFGAYVNLACHHDINTARELVKGGLTTFARFSVMHGKISGPADASQTEVLEAIHDRYDMTRHTQRNSQQAEVLTAEFIDRFAVVGTAARCVERIAELGALGLDKLAVSGPTFAARSAPAQEASALFQSEVLPALARDR